MATIIEDARIITINNTSFLPNTPPTHNNLPKYTYAVVTPTCSIEFNTLEEAHEWMPLIARRIVSEEEYRAHFVERFNSLKISNPEFFKRR